jgi:hypothetical protein
MEADFDKDDPIVEINGDLENQNLILTYDPDGRVVKILAKNAIVSEFVYSSDKIKVTKVNASVKEVETYSIGTEGKITASLDSYGNNKAYSYDHDGYLIQVKDDFISDLSYSNGNLIKITRTGPAGYSQTVDITYSKDPIEKISGTFTLKQFTNLFSNWKSRKSASDHNWYDIVWSPELSLFVAIATGNGNKVMTSSNGITWTAHPAASNNAWISITWSPELKLFAAVSSSGNGDRVMTSPDGMSWTSRKSAKDNSWRAIEWSPELRLFVAVAISGNLDRVMTSPDGINWTIQSSPSNNEWRALTWSPELHLFVAVSSSGLGNRVMTSKDGVEWLSKPSAEDNDWFGVAWSPKRKLFVAVADAGSPKRVMTSLDGMIWTSSNMISENSWHDVTWSPELGLYAALAYSGNRSRVMTSSDGLNWTTAFIPSNNLWMSFAWSEKLNIFAAVSKTGDGDRVMTGKIEDKFIGTFDADFILLNQGYFGKLSKNLVSNYTSTDKYNPYTVSYSYLRNDKGKIVSRQEFFNGKSGGIKFVY